MEIEIKVVNNRKLLSEFIHLPACIHRNHSNWLPPFYQDEWNFHNPKHNKALGYCDTVRAIAYRNNEARGRIMGIIHHPYNKQNNEKTARFCSFDCFDEEETASALLGFIEAWAKERGMEQVTGPYGFSDKDPQGFLIEGFDDLPLIDTSSNLPYMVDFTTAGGYSKLIDCYTYRFSINLTLPDIYQRVQQRMLNTKRYTVHEFKTKRELRPYIVPVLRLVNETYRDLYGFYTMDESEMHDLADRYMPVLDPRYVKIITMEGEVVAFVVGVPNLSKGIMRARGKLFPFGWYHILKSMKKSSQLDLMLGAVKPVHQGLGLEISMGLRLLESAKEAGIKNFETHLILEKNSKMRSVIERVDASIVKRFRIFTKKLPGN